MALALILRNASKIQAGAFQHFSRSTSVVMTKDFSSSLCHNQYLTKNKNVNVILAAPSKKILVAPQVRLMSADHSKLWPIEKAVSLGLLAIVPAAIATPNVILDNLLAAACVLHFHWGLEAVVVDYARPIVVGNILPKLLLGLLYLISISTLGGLIYYNTNEIGIGETIRQFWSINKGETEENTDKKKDKK